MLAGILHGSALRMRRTLKFVRFLENVTEKSISNWLATGNPESYCQLLLTGDFTLCAAKLDFGWDRAPTRRL